MPTPDARLRKLLWNQFLCPLKPEGIDLTDLVIASDGITGANIEQVCLDAKRTAVLANASEIDEIQLYRRLGLALALTGSVMLSTIEAEIQWLRHWDSKRFSLRNLAKIYGLSLRSVTNILKEETNSGREETAGTGGTA
jgi:SpoVK/Ycf46/Vps4 family AAA+-type ATPase